MSSVEGTPELKGGHPPAVKVGGMRVSQNKAPHPEKAEAKPVETTEEGEEEEETVAEKIKEPQLLISGAVTKGNDDFPAEAIKSFHDKGFTPNQAYGLRDHPRDNKTLTTQQGRVFQPTRKGN